MIELDKCYIDGRWVAPQEASIIELVNPATESVLGRLTLGGAADVDVAVGAAKAAFPSYSRFTVGERIGLLEEILSVYNRRYDEVADAICLEMGAPVSFAHAGQAARGPAHINALLKVLREFAFEADHGNGTRLRYEPVGVCGLITPWNWPVNQVMVKVAPALAAGCTMVLKPSEFSALSAALLAEIFDEAGVPPGVFNMIYGRGEIVGSAIAAHDDIAMVSFTGSTRAGIDVARTAALTVKRVTQELGGKSANILLDDVELETAVRRGVAACFTNSGQSCSIPTRMLVPAHLMDKAAEIAACAASEYRLGSPQDRNTQLGPVINKVQFDRIQTLIRCGIDEGARLVCGGPGKPEGLATGFYVQPTVFSNVHPDMTIAREEIFGPVLSIIPYVDEEDAVRIANGTLYGLAAYVQSSDMERARAIARRLNGGQVHINYPPADLDAPFGGYGRSGNGREWGEAGLREYLEIKALIGYGAGT